MSDNTETILRRALESHGAREFEQVALTMDADRGLAALNYAVEKGATQPIAYAIKLFDNEAWQPSGERRRIATNQHVERTCTHCGGDRFIQVSDGDELYAETYAPCKSCNANANTSRWLIDGTRRETAAA